jgi:hypothetical protein
MQAAIRFLQIIQGRASLPPPGPALLTFGGETLTFEGVPLTFQSA